MRLLTLVDPHLVVVPRLGTLATWRLAGLLQSVRAHVVCVSGRGHRTSKLRDRRETHRDREGLGGQADGPLNGEVLFPGPFSELFADIFELLDVSRCERDADFVDLLGGLESEGVSIGGSRDNSTRQTARETGRTGASSS